MFFSLVVLFLLPRLRFLVAFFIPLQHKLQKRDVIFFYMTTGFSLILIPKNLPILSVSFYV